MARRPIPTTLGYEGAEGVSSYSTGCLEFRYSEKTGVCYRRLDFLGYSYYRIGWDGSFWSRMVYLGAGVWVSGPRWQRRVPVKVGSYLSVGLSKKGKQKAARVHHLVLKAFVGPCPIGKEACHGNGDHLDNDLGNLRWDTRRNNALDKNRHGTMRRGENHGNSRLTNEQVLRIRKLKARGWTVAAIARKFDVTRRTVSMIVTGITWTHI